MVKFDYDEYLHQLVCGFRDRLDTEVSAQIETPVKEEIVKHLQQKPDEGLKVVFDFREVSFITSAFIRICITSAKTVNKTNFSIINTNPLIKKTLKIAGLDEELNVL
jgi:anti-anti-sigma factor